MNDPVKNLQCYLVGGAVRDRLMGIKSKDQDWVVVGSTVEEMKQRGFRQVGKDFPVFLHPQTGDEYALARTERKTARGYHGFEFNSSPDVTLDQDLSRRDLTINAMAMDENGQLTDPFDGQRDVEQKLIRHVSDAFKEDPVRVLRVARFSARFSPMGFSIADETNVMMSEMVESGEIDALVSERVWQEMLGNFKEKDCAVFFEVLRDCGALEKVFPEMNALFGIPQVEKFHPEIDTGIHTLMSVKAARKISNDPMIIFAVLVHDLGKALTPKSELPSHHGHENRGLTPIKNVCDRLGVPKGYRNFALKVCEFHLHCHRVSELKSTTVLKVLEKFDGFRNPEIFGKFTLCCLADKRGRAGHENDGDNAMQLFRDFHIAAMEVDGGGIAEGFGSGVSDGRKIKKEIRRQRLAAIQKRKETIQNTEE